MEMKLTNRTDVLIITAKTNDTPDLQVPRIITSSSGRDPLVKYMNEMFNKLSNNVSNRETIRVTDKFIDDSCAYVEYIEFDDENIYAVDMTIATAEVI